MAGVVHKIEETPEQHKSEQHHEAAGSGEHKGDQQHCGGEHKGDRQLYGGEHNPEHKEGIVDKIKDKIYGDSHDKPEEKGKIKHKIHGDSHDKQPVEKKKTHDHGHDSSSACSPSNGEDHSNAIRRVLRSVVEVLGWGQFLEDRVWTTRSKVNLKGV